MPATITDLSDLAGVGPPKQVRLVEGGQVYKLPADVPSPLYLKLVEFQNRKDEELDDAGEQEIVAELYEEVLELFRVHQPSLERLPIGLTSLIRLVPAIYGKADEEAAAAARPTRAAGTKSSSPKKRSRSTS